MKVTTTNSGNRTTVDQATVFNDGRDHEVGCVAAVAVGRHENRAGRNGRQCGRQRAHPLGGITARQVGEDQVGGCIVQKRQQHAGKPEIGPRQRLTVGGRDGSCHRPECPLLTGLEHGQHGQHRDEDADEQLGHLLHRAPIERVGLTHRARRDPQRHRGHHHQKQITQQILSLDLGAEDRPRKVRLPGATHQHQTDHRGQRHQVDRAIQAEVRRVWRQISGQHACAPVPGVA